MKPLDELIYRKCFATLWCDYRTDYGNVYRILVDLNYRATINADSDEEAIRIFEEGAWENG